MRITSERPENRRKLWNLIWDVQRHPKDEKLQNHEHLMNVPRIPADDTTKVASNFLPYIVEIGGEAAAQRNAGIFAAGFIIL
jgi:hypothetical protein